MLARRSTHQACYDAVFQFLLPRQTYVGYTRERDSSSKSVLLVIEKKRALADPMTASHPKGEMAAGRMANYSSSCEIEPRVRRHCLKNIAGCQADVLKGSRPTTAGVADPPILYVARDYSLRC